MYLKDKAIRINVRISPEQAAFLDRLVSVYGKSQSEIVRMIITSYMWGGNDADKQTNINNKL